MKIDYRTRLGKRIKAAEMMTKLLYDPHFARQFWCWSKMQHDNKTRLPLSGFADDCAYCLDCYSDETTSR